jgi:pyruvate/2-oxoglutarate dehydrogenase complex dihydrolipoamide dehydrogenase (E3) component
MNRIETDICVIGGGSGGLSVAAGAVQMGARVVLVEGAKMGGDCLNHGCVPSKALIAAAHRAHAMSGGFGIAAQPAVVDFGAVKDHVAQVIAGIAPHDSVERFSGLGVRVIEAFGRFTGPTTLEAGGHEITARRFVVATGSAPFVPPIPGLGDVPYLTNETLFEAREKPDHLLVIGGGPIGLEMAQAHRRLGCEVTVIEAQRAMGRDDPEVAATVIEALRAEGVRILEETAAQSVSGRAGAITVQLGDGAAVTGTHLLVAVGRKPNVEGLGLDAAGIAFGPRGIKVNDALRSTNRRVYAIGDVAGREQFTHVAGYHAGIVIRSAVLGLPARVRKDHIPRVTFTDPELAHVGLTEAEARKAHGAHALQIVRFSYSENDRARATGQTGGMVKVMVARGRPVGVSIVGAQAGELIGPWALAIANKLKMGAMASTVLPYPTLGEVNKRAAGAYFSPKLFDNPMLKRVVRFVQKVLP